MWKITSVLFVLLIFRVMVASLGHSGEGVSPKFGDYEAQRHWMELTTSLPLSSWYFNTSDNDLQYWGLDYPPLTAFHSWLCGSLAKLYEPASVALHSSRGYETTSHKIFMRATVIAADYLLLLPAVWLTVSSLYRDPKHRLVAFVAVAAQPGLMLIDHGHFQYNNISIGLAILAIGLILRDYDILGAVAFSLSLNYKQMSLYYAPAFFIALLCKCLQKGQGLTLNSVLRVACIGLAVVATFAASWLPFLLQDKPMEQVAQLLHRIFPVGRGLYEDKVANLWCSISPVFKLQHFASPPSMVLICSVLTVLGFLPACAYLAYSYYIRSSTESPQMAHGSEQTLTQSTKSSFIISLSLIAWSFFFFSFHVHEKSVLLPMVPMTLWIYYSPNLVSMAGLVSTVSMLPLLQRDGHEVSLLIACIVYAVVLKMMLQDRISLSAMFASIALPLSFHALSYIIKAPSAYPDLFVLLLTCSSFLIMGLCLLGIYFRLFFPLRQTVAQKVHLTKKTN